MSHRELNQMFHSCHTIAIDRIRENLNNFLSLRNVKNERRTIECSYRNIFCTHHHQKQPKQQENYLVHLIDCYCYYYCYLTMNSCLLSLYCHQLMCYYNHLSPLMMSLYWNCSRRHFRINFAGHLLTIFHNLGNGKVFFHDKLNFLSCEGSQQVDIIKFQRWQERKLNIKKCLKKISFLAIKKALDYMQAIYPFQ